MMKAMMRIDKTQVKADYKFIANGKVPVDLLKTVGYKFYEAVLIGAAGGAAGDAIGETGTIQYGAGGGGGGMEHIYASITTLDFNKGTVVVGAPGSTGAASATEGKAGNGGTGGSSTLGDAIAFGGKGAIGGDWSITGSGSSKAVSLTTRGEGGDGGSNGGALGTVGQGGKGSDPEQGPGFMDISDSSTAATHGQYEVAPGGTMYINGSGGGGGGCGRTRMSNFDAGNARVGGSGAQSSTFASGGGTTQASGNRGGFGGGADLFPFNGVHEYYGSGGNTSKNPGGVVSVKFT